ncbi:MAG: hypothetical protein HZY74_01140 [Brevundimonas sp.]|nr:MAG: hypothetical protein HZY74_01140 [Brevundimonas sp.]
MASAGAQRGPGESGDAALDWQLFGIAQTGKLDEANDRAGAAIETVEACETRDAAARRRRVGRRGAGGAGLGRQTACALIP